MDHTLGVANSQGKQIISETREVQIRSRRNQVFGNDHQTQKGENGSQEGRNNLALANTSKQKGITTVPRLYEFSLKIH